MRRSLPSKQSVFARGYSCILAVLFIASLSVGLCSVFHGNAPLNHIITSESNVLTALNHNPYDTSQWRALSELAFDKDKVALGINARNLSNKLSVASQSLTQYQETPIGSNYAVIAR